MMTLEDERFARIEKRLRDVEKRLQEDPCLPWATGFQVQLDRIRVRLDTLEGKALAQGEIGTGEQLRSEVAKLKSRLDREQATASGDEERFERLEAHVDAVERDQLVLADAIRPLNRIIERQHADRQEAGGVTPFQSLRTHLDGLQAMVLDNIRRLSGQQDSLREAFDFYEKRLVELSGRVSAMERKSDAAH